MTYILQTWRDSLKLFWTRSGLLLLLVTLKTIGQGYAVWLKYWGWLLGVMALMPFLFSTQCLSGAARGALDALCTVIPVAAPVFYIAFFLTMILAIRPSAYRKTYAYFAGYALSCIMIVLALLAFVLLLNVLRTDVHPLYSLLYYFLRAVYFMRTAFMIFFCLFFFDSARMALDLLHATKRAFQLLLYAMPVVIAMTLLLGFLQWCFVSFVSMMISYFGVMEWFFGPVEGLHRFIYLFYVSTLAELLFLPLWISAFSNIYTKNLYDHMERYFPRQK